MRKTILFIIVVGVFLVIFYGVQVYNAYAPAPTTYVNPVPEDTATSTEFQIKIGEKEIFGKLSVAIFALLEDSRCPKDVVCIQAGRATAGLNIEEIGENTPFLSKEVAIGDSVDFGGYKVTLQDILPYPISTQKTPDDEYIFKIKLENLTLKP